MKYVYTRHLRTKTETVQNEVKNTQVIHTVITNVVSVLI